MTNLLGDNAASIEDEEYQNEPNVMKEYFVTMSFRAKGTDPIHAQLAVLNENLVPINMSAEEIQSE